MEAMYLDKAGACAVLAAFRGAVEMNLKVNLTVTLGFAENAIGNSSYKPSEIIQSYHGHTVEINNTDAEGRLVLADCISWTQRNRNPTKMIEVSTLTGACAAALGESTAGLFTNNDELAKELLDVGEEV
jgi:leucyl aminopeptidase